MTFLPIVERELRVRARLRSTYRFRMFAASGAIVLAAFLLLAVQASSAAGRMGEIMFSVLAWVSFLFCLTDGARNTADCLSEEKRGGTMGLLFLTDLRGYDVVLGKLMATSLNSFYGLLAIFPALAIPLVIGGVTAGEFWRLVFLLMNTLFFSLTAGLLLSALCRDARAAWTGTVGLIVFFSAGPPLLLLSPTLSGSFLAEFSPTTAFLGLFDVRYSFEPERYWAAVRNINLSSWLFLGGASFILPHAWQDRPSHRRIDWTSILPAGFQAADTESARAKRGRLLDANPIVWLAARGETRRVALWAFVVLVAVVATVGWFLAQGTNPGSMFIFFTTLLSFFVLALWVSSEACNLFASSRDTGALELLMCTPVSTRQIVRGYIMGLHRVFLRPVLALVGVLACLDVAQLYVLAYPGTAGFSSMAILGLSAIQLFLSVLDLVAAAQFGMWMGLSQKKPATAVTKTVLYVLVFPFLGVGCVYAWPLLSAVKNIMFINYAQEKMRRHFRSIITERYGLVHEPEIVGQPSARALRTQLPPVLRR